eukprot:TRINITY_DN49568_c0_g1_i1.p1 TRINITY_DN49568_c0_g1~~TRINITY_DN49568_c0_g1_i1.p1  ORF type:complete len:336 (+),score=52.26 TRINITY_DN49568_c0_g1_i1:81-1088(+)
MVGRRQVPPPSPAPVPDWLSTTGGPRGPSQDRRDGVVRLVPTAAAAELGLKEFRLGSIAAGFYEAITFGSHEGNEAVLPLDEAAQLHCQFAVRSFKLPQHSDQIFEALFLRDVAEDSRTLVNGQPAFRPWQWLQDGDEIGLPCDAADGASANGAFDFFTVVYCDVQMLRGSTNKRAGATVKPAPLSSINGESSRRQASLASGAKSVSTRSTGRTKANATKTSKNDSVSDASFGSELIGKVIDVTYDEPGEPSATYRVKVVGFDNTTGWHAVDSDGYSVWKDEVCGDDSFTDEIDLNKMYARGLIAFVDSKRGLTPVVESKAKTRATGTKKRSRTS